MGTGKQCSGNRNTAGTDQGPGNTGSDSKTCTDAGSDTCTDTGSYTQANCYTCTDSECQYFRLSAEC